MGFVRCPGIRPARASLQRPRPVRTPPIAPLAARPRPGKTRPAARPPGPSFALPERSSALSGPPGKKARPLRGRVLLVAMALFLGLLGRAGFRGLVHVSGVARVPGHGGRGDRRDGQGCAEYGYHCRTTESHFSSFARFRAAAARPPPHTRGVRASCFSIHAIFSSLFARRFAGRVPGGGRVRPRLPGFTAGGGSGILCRASLRASRGGADRLRSSRGPRARRAAAFSGPYPPGASTRAVDRPDTPGVAGGRRPGGADAMNGRGGERTIP